MSRSSLSRSSLLLIDQGGHVFETDNVVQRWTAGCAEKGLPVEEAGPRVNQVLVEFSFVLPPLSAKDPGCYPIFALSRGTAPGKYWFPSSASEDCASEDCASETSPSETSPSETSPSETSPSETVGKGTGGVFLRVNYEPARGLIHCGMNAGTPHRELRCLSLGPAPPEQYTGRVLRAFVLIAPNGLFPSIDDADEAEAELFGELQFPRKAGASGYRPWGEPPTGNWYVTSGGEIHLDPGEKRLPHGFGLSDLRVHLADPTDNDVGMMPYSGDLDHLVEDPADYVDWPEFEDEDVPLGTLLQSFASSIDGMAKDANVWARRALELADETDELATRLAEEKERDED